MSEIDSLEIKLQANATKANDSIDSLITKLTRLSASLSSVNGSSLSELATSVGQLTGSMQGMKSVGTADFTRLAKNISQINNANTDNLNNVASSINNVSSAFNQLGTVSENAVQLSEVAKNIAKLGNKSVQTAITNMPQLADSLKNLLTTLSTAPTVSGNVIQMTNALANLSAQGARVGSASRTIQRGLNNVNTSATRTAKSVSGLAAAFGKFFAAYWIAIRGMKSLWNSIEGTTDYIETFNYYTVAFNKIGSEWGKDFEKYGYENATDYAKSFSDRVSTLLGKMSGLQVDVEGGLLTADATKNLGLNIQEITQYASQLASVTNSLGQTGETTTAIAKSMTMLAGDISSLFNVDYSTVATNLQSGLIGQSRALYKYGIDITNATLATYAYKLGIEKSVSEMTQAEKQQLRVLAILDQSKVAWTDLARTINSPSNMLRQFNTNVKETSMVLGQIFIPVLQKVMPMVNGTTIAIKRLLVSFAQFMGIKIDFDAFGQSGYKDTADGLEDIADGYDDVAKAADKAKKGVRGFDELEVINTGSDTSTGGADGSTIDLTDEIVKATEEYEKAWNEAFENMENESSQFADKVSGFFEKVLKPLDTWGSKIEWTKIGNGLESIWDFAKKFTKNTGEGFLTFIEALADIGAPVINVIADAIELLFDALGSIPESTLQAIGGGLGGIFITLATYKLTKLMADGISAVFGSTTTGIGGLVTLAMKHPFLTLASGIAAIIGAIVVTEKNKEAREEIKLFGDTLDNLRQKYNDAIDALDARELEIKATFEASDADIGKIETLWKKYTDLAQSEELTAEQQLLLKQYAEELVGYIPELNDMIDTETGYFTAQYEEIEKVIAKQKELYRVKAAEEAATEIIKLQIQAEVDKEKLQQELEGYKNTIDTEIKPWLDALQSGVPLEGAIYDPRTDEYQAMYEKMGRINERVKELYDEIGVYDDKIAGYEEEINSYLTIASKSSTELANSTKQALDSIHNDTKKTFTKFKEEAIDFSEETTKSYGTGLGIGNSRYIAPKLKEISLSLIDYFNMSSDAESAGENTAKGFERGLSKVGSSIATTASNLASGVVKIFQTALDIHSPSRVMFEIGGYTIEGFKEGMESLYEPTTLSLKNFGFETVEAIHPPQMTDYSSYAPSRMAYDTGTTENYYNSSTNVDNAETNALLRELITAVKQGSTIQIDGNTLAKTVRKEDRSYFLRTGRGMFEH